MKRKKIVMISISSAIAAILVITTIYILKPKNNIYLERSNFDLTWSVKDNKIPDDSKFEVYNEKFKVAETVEQKYSLTEENLVDEKGPDIIKKATIDYGKDVIGITWESIDDLGSDNDISIKMYDQKDKLLEFSNDVRINYVSGFSKYYIEYMGETFDTTYTKFEIDRSKLQAGENKINIYSMDKRGNKSEIAQIPVYNYNATLTDDNSNITCSIGDKLQQYTYSIFINDSLNEDLTTIDMINTQLKDTSAPNEVGSININTSKNIISANWNDVKDRELEYKIRVEAVGNSYKNRVYSNELTVDKSSGVKGYFYAINDTQNYSVTEEKDTFVEKPTISVTSTYGTHYIHVAAIDNNGNISTTTTKSFTLVDPTPIPQSPIMPNIPNIPTTPTTPTVNKYVIDEKKKALIAPMVIKDTKTTTDTYDQTLYLISKLPDKLLNSYKQYGLNIYIADDEAEPIYKQLTGTDITGISGVFFWVGKQSDLIFESKNIYKSLYHELGHAADYVIGDTKFITEDSSTGFDAIFEQEKDKLLPDGYTHEKEDKKEYFGEAFQIYFLDNARLRTNAPKTYEYIEKYIMN